MIDKMNTVKSVTGEFIDRKDAKRPLFCDKYFLIDKHLYKFRRNYFLVQLK